MSHTGASCIPSEYSQMVIDASEMMAEIIDEERNSKALIQLEIEQRKIEAPKSIHELLPLSIQAGKKMKEQYRECEAKWAKYLKKNAALQAKLSSSHNQDEIRELNKAISQNTANLEVIINNEKRIERILSYTHFDPKDLEAFQKDFVSSAQLVECRECKPEEIPASMHKDAQSEEFDLFYMRKVYTYQGKRYSDDTVVRVLAGAVDYNYSLQKNVIDHMDEKDRYYQNLEQAKYSFLKNSQHLAKRHQEQKAIAEVPEPQHAVSGAVTYSKFLSSADSMLPAFKTLSKLVTINGISYIITESKDLQFLRTDRLFSAAKDEFVRKEPSEADRYYLMTGNYKKFDLIEEFTEMAARSGGYTVYV